MTASDQETPAESPAPSDASELVDAPAPAGVPAVDGPVPADGPAPSEVPAAAPGRMTPRQARTLRIAAASVVLVALGAVLAVRLASRTSVLVVGVYGLAMILCGVVIELSRHGRTRLGTYLLGAGLAAALAADWLLLP
ncbi:hypothetical protein QMZ92_31585 [Streptomyces sp. HNM0645]|uniref:hypothetical protein n=1 Tax=Streptomyces sp. HNM0645 TaxID=2782343 RepID=UPI0024B6F3B9|nr:hypothetical protein [Streptomyces sp. HNM0645]MDI9888771.1 hypothetical protein [Streptomyces sp. HNM0645]